MAAKGQVPSAILRKLRPLCLALPEAREEQAWTGTRWRIGSKTFAHALRINQGWPPHYARATHSAGPLVVLMFRSPEPERFDAAPFSQAFFRPGWFPDLVGLKLGERVDWDEVADLMLESYCHLAPKRLLAEIAGRGTTSAPATRHAHRPRDGRRKPRPR